MRTPLGRSSALKLLLQGPIPVRPRDQRQRPVRIADFFDRSSDADAGTDTLTCRECKQAAAYDRGDMPAIGSLIACSSCGLPSRVPVSG